MEKKAVCLRLGVTVMLSEKEIMEIKKGGPAGKGMIQDLFNIGKFALDGETYIPSCPAGDREWPVEEDVEYTF